MLQNTFKYSKITNDMVEPSVLETINPYEPYSPRQIAIRGFIKNNAGNAHDIGFILRQVKRGELKAVNINREGKRPTWRVSGQQIIDYLQTH
jgi:hypothetical protein